MKLKNTFWIFLVLTIIGCSNDDAPVEEVEAIPIASFQVIGEDANKVYQYVYNGETDAGNLFDLTSDLGVLPSYLTLRQVDDFISFYSFRAGAFSLAQKNINTGATANFEDFYANGPDRAVVWGTNTLNSVFFGYFASGDARVLAIQDVALQDFTSQDLTIDFNIDLLFQPLLFNNKVYITYLDNEGNYKLTFYDTSTKVLGSILNFNNTPISILIDSSGNLAVIKNGVNATLETYDSDSLSLIGSSPLAFNTGFSAGPVEGAVLNNNKLYYALPFAQPSRFAAGPAVFDLITQENFAIDFLGIINEIEQETGLAITLSTQRYSSKENMFLVGYALLETGNEGGVLQISPDGKLVNNVTFPFFPTDIIKD